MNALNRLLLAVALLVWVALPGISGDGGENAGGTGVWILPRATPLAAVVPSAPPRADKLVSNLNQDLVMQVSAECGNVVGTFVDDIAAVPTALPVVGSLVRVPASLLQALVASGGTSAHVVVTDGNHVGYVIELTVVQGTVVVRCQ
jgi:hypothetical protein